MPIYVAGPVIRPVAQPPNWVIECYQVIAAVVRPRFEAQFPVAEPLLERMEAGGFAAELMRRIAGADSMIAVFLPGDQSTPVECALAAAARKRVLLIFEARTKLPRILVGMPGVTTAIYGPDTYGLIVRFLRG